jgi:1-acyl-sn-glycerol-3-phosphate acyltransferase
MLLNNPLLFSHLFLASLGAQTNLAYAERIPRNTPLLVVSNHRSFMDAPLLMTVLGQPIRFACHHYLEHVPILREIIEELGCFPLKSPGQRQQSFFQQANSFFEAEQTVGVFPEGAQATVQLAESRQIKPFQRGFAHLALRSPISNLVILPVAIAAQEEITYPGIPLQFLKLFDSSEPYFDQAGWHPFNTYRRVSLLVGHPYQITSTQQQQYQGKQAKLMVHQLTDYCQAEITHLLQQGCP